MEILFIRNPSELPDVSKIAKISEPIIKATILLPDEYLGPVTQLCTERRGVQTNLTYVGKRAMVICYYLFQKWFSISMIDLNLLQVDMRASIMNLNNTKRIS